MGKKKVDKNKLKKKWLMRVNNNKENKKKNKRSMSKVISIMQTVRKVK